MIRSPSNRLAALRYRGLYPVAMSSEGGEMLCAISWDLWTSTTFKDISVDLLRSLSTSFLALAGSGCRLTRPSSWIFGAVRITGMTSGEPKRCQVTHCKNARNGKNYRVFTWKIHPDLYSPEKSIRIFVCFFCKYIFGSEFQPPNRTAGLFAYEKQLGVVGSLALHLAEHSHRSLPNILGFTFLRWERKPKTCGNPLLKGQSKNASWKYVGCHVESSTLSMDMALGLGCSCLKHPVSQKIHQQVYRADLLLTRFEAVIQYW